MLINAVSTLEIEIAESHENALKCCVSHYISGFEKVPGCLAYGLTKSAQHPQLWLLSGYWDNRETMWAHFGAKELDSMIWMISKRALGVRFTSYLSQTVGAA
jgi:quinol monooxygenase YgiN